MRELLREPEIRRLILLLLLAEGCAGFLSTCFGEFALSHLHFSGSAQIGAFFPWYSIPDCAVCFCVGYLTRVLVTRRQAVSFGALLVGLFLHLSTNIYLEKISFVGVGLGLGLIDGVCPSLIGSLANEIFPGRMISKVYVLYAIAML